MSITGRNCSMPNITAPSMVSSASSLASDSTIITASAVPATTRSSCESFVCASVGHSTNRPSIQPTRAAPIGPRKGTPLMVSAAELPIIATMSGSVSPSCASTVATTWTSLRKPSGNSGRIGRSIRREVRVSFSVGRPSRLKKPPGILPAAKVFSW